MKLILLILSIFSIFLSQELDNKKRIELMRANAFNELEKKGSILTFINIRDNSLEVTGSVEINGREFELEHGKLSLDEDYLTEIGDKEVILYFTSETYINTEFRLPVYIGNIYKTYFYVLDRMQPNKVHIVLDWNNSARKYDLDSHLKSNSMHVYYRNSSERGSYGERAKLSRDITRTNAYEMITIDKPSEKDTYNFIVKKYRGRSDWISKNVTVSLYFDNKLVKLYSLNNGKTSDDDYWYVFKLGAFGHVEDVNKLVNDMNL